MKKRNLKTMVKRKNMIVSNMKIVMNFLKTIRKVNMVMISVNPKTTMMMKSLHQLKLVN